MKNLLPILLRMILILMKHQFFLASEKSQAGAARDQVIRRSRKNSWVDRSWRFSHILFMHIFFVFSNLRMASEFFVAKFALGYVLKENNKEKIYLGDISLRSFRRLGILVDFLFGARILVTLVRFVVFFLRIIRARLGAFFHLEAYFWHDF